MLFRRFTRDRNTDRGFTLLELVMVMTIIVILASIGVASYQQIQLKARETILKEDLRQMRKMIDQFAADKEHGIADRLGFKTPWLEAPPQLVVGILRLIR